MISDKAARIERQMRGMADPAHAQLLQRFFKTGRGEYGEGDLFLGLHLPMVRRLATGTPAPHSTRCERLLESRWHEVRMLGVVLLALQYREADQATRRAIYRLYLRRTDRINNWDLVDVSAPGVVGTHLLTVHGLHFAAWHGPTTYGSAASLSSRRWRSSVRMSLTTRWNWRSSCSMTQARSDAQGRGLDAAGSRQARRVCARALSRSLCRADAQDHAQIRD